MKKYIFPLFAVTVIAAACHKDESAGPNLPDANYITANLDNSYWVADDVTRSTNGGDTVRFTGSRGSSKPVTIQLVINKYRGPGTYKLNDTLAGAVYTDVNGTYYSYSGAISITADDATHMSAGFEVHARAGGAFKDITDGQLNVKK